MNLSFELLSADDYPGAPIDYRISEPAPYESYEEYLWFIGHIRKELDAL